MQFYYSSGFISISHARYQACWIQKALVHLYERWHQMVFPLIIISRFTSSISKTVRSASSLLSVVKTPAEMPALLFWSGWVWVPVPLSIPNFLPVCAWEAEGDNSRTWGPAAHGETQMEFLVLVFCLAHVHFWLPDSL